MPATLTLLGYLAMVVGVVVAGVGEVMLDSRPTLSIEGLKRLLVWACGCGLIVLGLFLIDVLP
jgi:hypothetical protein